MHRQQHLILGGLVGATFLSGVALASPWANATGTQSNMANATVTVASTCSMTASIATGKEHAARIINGQYQADIGETVLQTFCNDPSGYVIYAMGYTGGEDGVTAGTNTVLHSTTLGSSYDIVTGTNTNSGASNWAMKLTAVTGDDQLYAPTIATDENNLSFASYHAVPDSYTKVAYFDSQTDTATIGSSLKTTYAAYIDTKQPAGTYSGQVRYVMVHPSSMPSPDEYDYVMQEVADWKGILTVDKPVTAIDLRDLKTYEVMLARDGKVWMVQNLDLCIGCQGTAALTSENTDLNVISSDNSGPYYNGYEKAGSLITWTPTRATVTNMNHDTGKVANWTNSYTSPWSAEPGDYYGTGTRFNSSLCNVTAGEGVPNLLTGNQTCNYLSSQNMDSEVSGATAYKYFSTSPWTTNGEQGHVGNYYNWTAAIASNDSSSYTTSTMADPSGNPENSICPKGWRLPKIATNTANSEFYQLNRLYNNGSTSTDEGLFNLPLGFVRSGYVNSGSLYYAGNNGYYWSSTVESGTNARYLSFYSGYVNPANSINYRNYGFSVRCVAE